MKTMPRDKRFDSTFQLLSSPYDYIGQRCTELGTDVFRARIMLQPTVCMSGVDAARLFYDSQRFRRQGAAPEPLRATLFGEAAVQGLDGAAHRRRKSLFLEILKPDRVAMLAAETRAQWEAACSQWTPCDAVPLYEVAQEVLARAVLHWAGVTPAQRELAQRTRELVSLFDDAARGISPHFRSRTARRSCENWLHELITSVRNGQTEAAPGTALHIVAWHLDASNAVLHPRTAAVELLNVLRPVVAVSVYIVWCAHALHSHPASRDKLHAGDQNDLFRFLQEVRRYYPFFPAVVARVRQNFEWKGLYFHKGQRALLDLYGTNHDPRTWSRPEQFNPERFRGLCPGRFELVPQGGGDAATHHRCPGEDAALALMAVFMKFLVQCLSCDLVSQDFRIDKKRLPALPCSPLLLKLDKTRHAAP